MKLTIALLLAFISQGCGKGLQDPAKLERLKAAIATGAEMILDASNITGACPGSVPWPDTSGNGNDGTIECAGGGSVAASPARVLFDGATTHVTTNIDGNNVDMPSATWIVMVKPNSAAFSHILSIDDHAGAWNRSLIVDNAVSDVFGVFNRNPNGFWEALGVDLAQWQYVVVEFTADDIKFQKNATRASKGAAPLYNNTSLDFTIGSSADRTNDWFDGEIGWVAIYPRILSQKEITQTCLALVGRFSGVTCQ